MIEEQPKKGWIVIITAIIGVTGTMCVALATIGVPFAERASDKYFGTESPTSLVVAATKDTVQTQLENTSPTLAPVPTESEISSQEQNIGTNLINDGGFENGLGTWSYDSRHNVGIIYPSDGYLGSSVCSRQNLTEQDVMGWVGIGRNVNVESGRKYKYSAWVKAENVTQFNAHIEWGNPIEYNIFQVMDGTTDNWQLWEAEFTVPSDVYQIRLAFWHGVKDNQTNVSGGIICIDEVSLRLIE